MKDFMKDFKNIENDVLLTGKDKILEYASGLSGLDKTLLNGLYESFSFQSEGDSQKIIKMFKNYFTGSKDFDFEAFKDEIKSIYDEYFKDQSEEKRKELNVQLLSAIHKNLEGVVDIMVVLKIVGFICYLKSTEKITLNESQIKPLFESLEDKINITKYNSINLTDTNYSITNEVNAKEDLVLYDSLKQLLNTYSKSYGNNRYITNMYSIIVDFINQKSIEASNYLYVETVNSKIYCDFIEEIINGSQMNIMYQNIDYLKSITPDLQNLVFDLMLLVNGTVNKCTKYNDYIDQKRINQYNLSTRNLFEAISSSVETSYLLHKSAKKTKIEATSDNSINPLSLYLYDINGNNIPNLVRLSLDCLMIIKAVQNEFVIKMRKLMNLYISNAIELIISYKHIDLKLRGKGQQIFFKD